MNLSKFYINGAWVEPVSAQRLDVLNPATEDSVGQIAIGNAEDADRYGEAWSLVCARMTASRSHFVTVNSLFSI